MRARGEQGAVVGWTASLVAAVLLCHPLVNAVHFLAVDHGAATAHGTLGHHHSCEHAHQPEQETALASPVPPDGVVGCAYEVWLVRNEGGEEPLRAELPSQLLLVLPHLAATVSGGSPGAALLALAPKHSPPIA